MPAFRAWGEKETWHEGEGSTIQPKKNPYLGPVVVLIGPGTVSAAEDFVVALHASGRATLVEAASGADFLSPHTGLGAASDDGFANAGLIDGEVLNAMNDGDVQVIVSVVRFSPTWAKSARGVTLPKSMVLPPAYS